MNRRAILLASAVLLVAVIARLIVLRQEPRLGNDLSDVKASVVAWVQQSSTQGDASPSMLQLRSLGFENIQRQRLDPEARVILRPGSDGQPGVAGVDDNGNGVVDDISELGATLSDDVCLVSPTSQVDQDRSVLVLQRGAFVPVSPETLAGGQPSAMRWIVTGRSGGEPWSFLLSGGEIDKE